MNLDVDNSVTETTGCYRSNNVSLIVQSIANVALCNPFSVFSNNCDTLNVSHLVRMLDRYV